MSLPAPDRPAGEHSDQPIVNPSSPSGICGNVARAADYAALQAGITGFTESPAEECGPRGVRANVVAPGLIATDTVGEMSGATLERMRGTLRSTGSASPRRWLIRSPPCRPVERRTSTGRPSRSTATAAAPYDGQTSGGGNAGSAGSDGQSR
ncbi:SDR family NAD(P)-dependent oxidoreductase [Kitasatospora sp. NPDC017646]|uniref:SDR family NAD(P)-dependent oxidoreductase n=1 Tax=Kitasatospora sp. NPDC017646 TaxID=3364024 RepID=UPI0037BDABD6